MKPYDVTYHRENLADTSWSCKPDVVFIYKSQDFNYI